MLAGNYSELLYVAQSVYVVMSLYTYSETCLMLPCGDILPRGSLVAHACSWSQEKQLQIDLPINQSSVST